MIKRVKILENSEIIDKAFEEHYNLIRTNIQLCGSDIKSILITSTIKNEGKSSVSINIALSLAKLGLKVLYIDADIRKSLIVRRFQFSDSVEGLTSYLSGLTDIENVIYQTELENLSIIPAGKRAPNPTELLQNVKFSQMMNDFVNYFNYIIVDTPPLGQVIDPLIVAKKCDASILVVQSNISRRKFVLKTINQLEKSGSKFLGVVLNKVNLMKNKYGAYGDYGNYGNY